VLFSFSPQLHVEFGLSTEVGMKKKNQILFAQSIVVSIDHSLAGLLSDWFVDLVAIFFFSLICLTTSKP